MRPISRVIAVALIGLAACLDGSTEPAPGDGGGLSLKILPGPGGVAALDSGHVVVAGPTNRTVKVTPGTTVTIDQLLPGSYTVTLQGFQGGGVAYFGQTSGVTVVAGQNATATVTFTSFRPTILELPAYTTDGQFVLVYSKVAAAASYVVQRAPDASFTSPTETVVAATDTSVALTIPLTGPFHLRVLAVDPLGARGLASVAQVTTTLTSVTVTPATASIAPGATQQFAAVAKDALNNIIAGITFFWVSSNQSVALVDQTGLATGLTGGSATISALGLGVPGGAALTVSATVPTQLAFTVQPSNAVAGDALSPALQVEVRDAGGTRVAGARDPVTLAFAANPGSGTLAGTKTVNAVNGVATFSGLSVNKVATGYTLAASSGSLAGATSAAFDIAPGAAAAVAFTAQPTNAVAGVAIAPTVQVSIVDRFGNTVTSATDQIVVAIGTNPGGGTLSGTATQAAVAGVASFANLTVNKTATGYNLVASSGALSGGTSVSFSITAAAAAALAFLVQSSGVEPQAVIAPSIQVAIRDAFGNSVTSATNSVTIAIGTNPSAGVLSGTAIQSAVGGVADFADLAISASGNGYTLVATATGLTSATTTPFDVFLVFVQVSVGAFGRHTCGVTTSGAAYCWGLGSNGRLGNNGTASSSSPVRVTGGQVFASVTPGASHTCGVTPTGVAYCWGFGGSGRLGNGGTADALVPTLVSGTNVFASVSAGEHHTCGITTTGAARCWGLGGNGRLGNGGTADALVPTAVTGANVFASLTARGNHTCAVQTDGVALCWGSNFAGQLGNGTLVDATVPTGVSGINVFASISAGSFHTCGITTTGVALCWGSGGSGQLGDGGIAVQSTPVPVVGGLNFASVSGGEAHTCGTTTSGDAFCWGSASSGALGNGANAGNFPTPVSVVGAHAYGSLAAGNSFACGGATDGAFCWGSNGNGQLGAATTTSSSTPVRVIGSR